MSNRFHGVSEEVALAHFYREVAIWVRRGTPLHLKFDASEGLCHNVFSWALASGLRDKAYAIYALLKLHVQHFRDTEVTEVFPFNSGIGDYKRETKGLLVYQNEKRLTFIRDRVEWAHQTIKERT